MRRDNITVPKSFEVALHAIHMRHDVLSEYTVEKHLILAHCPCEIAQAYRRLEKLKKELVTQEAKCLTTQ